MIDRTLNYGRHLIQKFLVDAMPFQNALDLGPGAGNDLLLARKVNPSVELYGIEASKEYIQNLKDLNINLYNLNIEKENLPFPNESIDVILMNQILEHTKEVFWIFHEVTRVLKQKGNLILGVPNLASLHNRLLLALGIQPSPIKTNSAHVRGFTKGDVVRFVQSCFPEGYRIAGYGGSNFYPFPGFLAKRLAKAFPSMAWGIFFRFEKQRVYSREFIDFPIEKKLETNFYVGE